MIKLTTAQREALSLLITTFETHAVAFQITGGLAGNFHGSRWPLHDLDLEVDAPLADIAALLADFVTSPPARYQDSEFDLELLQLEIGGVPVDISSVRDYYVFSSGARIGIETDLRRAVVIAWDGRSVPVQPLDELIRYKRLLERWPDVADLEALAD